MPTVNSLVAAGRYMSPEDLMVGAQWLRVLAVLPKDLGSIPSTQILAHNLTPVLEDLILSSGLPGYHPCTLGKIPVFKTKLKKKKKEPQP